MPCLDNETICPDEAVAGPLACQQCENGGRMAGSGVKFERTRRITGYLVGTLDRWNDAKRAEERDRVKHD